MINIKDVCNQERLNKKLVDSINTLDSQLKHLEATANFPEIKLSKIDIDLPSVNETINKIFIQCNGILKVGDKVELVKWTRSSVKLLNGTKRRRNKWRKLASVTVIDPTEKTYKLIVNTGDYVGASGIGVLNAINSDLLAVRVRRQLPKKNGLDYSVSSNYVLLTIKKGQKNVVGDDNITSTLADKNVIKPYLK